MAWIIDSLKDAISNIIDRSRFREAVEDRTDEIIDVLMANIEAEQPHGHVEKLYGETVSKRLNHTPISDGWSTSVFSFMNTVSIQLRNKSEHINWVLEGTPRHDIPLMPKMRGVLYFWWGSPHRWPPKDNLPPGERRFKQVDHPGATPNPFVSRAIEQSKESMRGEVQDLVISFISDAVRSEGFKER